MGGNNKPNEKIFYFGMEKWKIINGVRDKTHMMLFRVWQNALMDSPASQNELWSLVNSTYGEGSRSRNSDVENDVSNDGASNHSYDGLEVQMRPRLYSNIQVPGRGIPHLGTGRGVKGVP